MRQPILPVIAAIVIAAGIASAAQPVADGPSAVVVKPVEVEKPLVQIAILLDTSSSMSGLIDQARTELWAIVNEFIFARRDGLEPNLQVALYEYGNDGLVPGENYIRMICPLTTDLDEISEKLFALTTNGGQEYCGAVIKHAAESLQWSSSPDDLKVIFIAGNEPFTQGPIDHTKACKLAVGKNIIVNTIHCGDERLGVTGKWKDGAILADGKFLNINHNQRVVHIEAPQDKVIAELGAKLNSTYIAFGRDGVRYRQRQTTQDMNASNISREAAVQRAVAKGSFNYRNDNWDLVDAVKNDRVELAEVEIEQLPEEMREMTETERKEYVEKKTAEREQLQARIQKLNEERGKYVAEQRKKLAGGSDTLGSAVLKAIRSQAETRKFKFEKKDK